MRPWICSAFLVSALLQTPLRAVPFPDEYARFLGAALPTDEQRASILFEGKIQSDCTPRRVVYKLHNGTRDSGIVGVILEVSFNDPASGKRQSMDIFSSSWTSPLSTTLGNELVIYDDIEKLDPKVSLKEVRLTKLSSN